MYVAHIDLVQLRIVSSLVLTRAVNTMLIGDDLPELGADLITALPEREDAHISPREQHNQRPLRTLLSNNNSGTSEFVQRVVMNSAEQMK